MSGFSAAESTSAPDGTSAADGMPHSAPGGGTPRKNRRRRVQAVGTLGALLLAACLSDGPNRVGGSYLESHDILLETPVYKVTLANFPVDSFWIEDLNLVRQGDTAMLLGVEDGFTSRMRLVYNLPDSALIDSLEADSSLRLSLGFYRFPNYSVARPALEATLKDATQLKVLVESWVVKDNGLEDKVRAESLFVRNHRFLMRQDTATLIPGTPVLDTITLKLDEVYKSGVPDSLQAGILSRLRDTLRTDRTAKWHVQMQLTPLPDTSDPGSQVMLRLGGGLSDNNPFAPWLLFGRQAASSLDAAKGTQRIYPMMVPKLNANYAVAGVNYRVTYDGDPNAILVGKNQGMHLRLNRAAFLDSLKNALQAQGIAFKSDSTGEFDLSYFVPFAHIRLPIDTSWAEQDVSLRLRLTTDFDSLLPIPPDPKAKSHAVIPFETDTALVVLTDDIRRVDTLRVGFDAPPQDPLLRRIIIRSSRYPNVVDTVFFHVGETRPIIPTVSTSTDRLVLTVTADSAAAQVDMHLNTKTQDEENGFRDPETGKPITELNRLIPGFFRIGTDSVALRATRSFQRLLNRARLGEEIESDLFLQPLQLPAYDPATNARVPYPVVGAVRPAQDSAGLGIGVTIYLYPLKDR